jgi:hypothetical protein
MVNQSKRPLHTTKLAGIRFLEIGQPEEMVSYYAGCHFTDNKKNEVLMEFGSMVEPQ